MGQHVTPKQLVSYLDQYIVGQQQAKRAIAIAVRNRYRRMQLTEEEREEIIPKNILMIGPTGVGKTEIARRMARYIRAPFIKVEATKFTEVGYVGRDVESIIRDLVEVAVRLVKEDKRDEVKEEAKKRAEERLIDLLMPEKNERSKIANPFEMLFGQQNEQTTDEDREERMNRKRKRSEIGAMLRIGKLEDEVVKVDVPVQGGAVLGMMDGMNEQMNQMQEALSSMLPKQTNVREMKVKDARRVLEEEEADRLLDTEEVNRLAIEMTEQSGIVFLDEFDKIASTGSQQSADVSREGVQLDILPIVEGSTVKTKYGLVKTDFILFIAAGAFHISKPSDIIPELQGRFPIRVELDKLTKEDFVRILTEPEHALPRQYTKLLATENVTITFEEEAIERLATIATKVNDQTENIGARRLHTIMEKLLEDLSFEAPDIQPATVSITASYVDDKLDSIVEDKDLSQFIL